MTQDGGPAFPSIRISDGTGIAGSDERVYVPGMSLRDWLVGHVDIPWEVATRIAREWNGHEPDTCEICEVRAKLRLMEADAILKARQVEGKGPE